MIETTPSTLPHWTYFLAIERDLEELSRYVEFDERNFDCFSIEAARLLLAAGAEADVVLKEICNREAGSEHAESIGRYREVLLRVWPTFPLFQVELPRFGLRLRPWSNWAREARDGQVPDWWTANNKVKHHRSQQFDQANLRHTLNAVAGLYIAVMHLYLSESRRARLLPHPRLFRPSDAHLIATRVDELTGTFGWEIRIPQRVRNQGGVTPVTVPLKSGATPKVATGKAKRR